MGQSIGLGDVRGAVDRPRRGLLLAAQVARGEPRDEVGIAAAPARPRGIGGQEGAVEGGAAEAVGRDGRLERDAQHAVGVVEQVLQHDTRAHAPAHEVHSAGAERLEHARDIVGEVAQPARRVDGLDLRAAEAAQVDGESAPLRREGQHRGLVEVRGRHVAVDEDDGANGFPLGGSLEHRSGEARRGHGVGKDARQKQLGHDRAFQSWMVAAGAAVEETCSASFTASATRRAPGSASTIV